MVVPMLWWLAWTMLAPLQAAGGHSVPDPRELASHPPLQVSSAETEAVPPEVRKGERAGTWECSLRATYTNERAGKNEGIGTITPAAGWYATEWLQFRGELPFYYTNDRPDGFGIGTNVGLRAITPYYGRFALFGEVHSGMFVADERFPDEGTHFNFTYHGGVGAQVRIIEEISLEVGGRFQHVSNFFIEGRARNPASNMYGGFIGLAFPL